MRNTLMIVLALAVCGLAACDDTSAIVTPGAPGFLTVFVQFDNQGIPDKTIEILDEGLVHVTDETGLATFTLKPGDYIVRAYGINQGGPDLRYLDTPVTIRAGRGARIEIVDCLPCV